MPPNPHGTTTAENAMRLLGTTATSAYRLDVDQLAREVLTHAEGLVVQTGRYACAVRLCPQDRREAMKHRPAPGQQPYWAPSKGPEQHDTFAGLPLIVDEGVPRGHATLEICPGCMRCVGRCEYRGE